MIPLAYNSNIDNITLSVCLNYSDAISYALWSLPGLENRRPKSGVSSFEIRTALIALADANRYIYSQKKIHEGD
jgi:hypothetical protein